MHCFTFSSFFLLIKGGQYGAISAMGFNTDSTRLICGYARGQVNDDSPCGLSRSYLTHVIS